MLKFKKYSYFVLALILFCQSALAADPFASRVRTDTTAFDTNLSGADTTVQAALNTLDELVGGGGAPTDATYLTLSTNVTLTGERVLTGTANQVIVTDNGAGVTAVLSLPQSIATSSSPTFAGATINGDLTVDTDNLFVDSTNNRVGIGTITPSLSSSGVRGFQIVADATIAEMRLTSYRASGPRGLLKSQAALGTLASPSNVATGTSLFRIDGEGYGDGGFRRSSEIEFYVGTGTVSSTSLPGRLTFSTSPDGTIATTEKLRIDSTNVVFNENSLDHDFRIESNGNANMFFVDGGADFIGIGTATPSATFDLVGNGEITGYWEFLSATSPATGVEATWSPTGTGTMVMQAGSNVTIQADEDASGTGSIILRTAATDRLVVTNAGLTQMGDGTNYTQVDADGDLSFVGTASYLVAGNTYAFRYSADEDAGLYFNISSSQFEFRNTVAASVLSVNVSSGLSTSSGDISINGGDLLTNQTTFNLVNATATTLNIGGAATTIGVGASTGTLTVNNTTLAAKAGTFSTTLTVTGDAAINGGDITTSGNNLDFTVNGANIFQINNTLIDGVTVSGALTVTSISQFQNLMSITNTAGSLLQLLTSTATNDDPIEDVIQNRVATTNNTQTTLHTFTIPASTTVLIKAFVTARRTGGALGAAEDGAAYEITAVYKNVAGTATIISGVPSLGFSAESQALMDATFTVSGATVLCSVTGTTSNNFTWHMTARTWYLST